MKRKILLRFDDLCPTMDFVQFNKAIAVLKKYEIKPLLGIIPDCQDKELHIELEHGEYWDYIKQLQRDGYTLAMHGYQHVYDNDCRGNVNLGFKSEFAGHSYEEQYRKIKAGKEILKIHGIDTDIFFAPAHSYDKNTLRALSANGFQYMSDGKGTKPIVSCGILCIPCRSGGVPKICRHGCYTAVFHAHEWVRKDKADAYKQLQMLCQKYSADIVDFNEFVQQDKGNAFVQKLIEREYVYFERNIRPFLSKIKSSLIRKNR